jgi:hypothetical protein
MFRYDVVWSGMSKTNGGDSAMEFHLGEKRPNQANGDSVQAIGLGWWEATRPVGHRGIMAHVRGRR